MKIALINENSQAAKNAMVQSTLGKELHASMAPSPVPQPVIT